MAKQQIQEYLVQSITLSLILCTAVAGRAQDRSRTLGAEVSPPVTPYVFNGDIRDLPPAPEWHPGDPIHEIPRRHNPRPDKLNLDLIPLGPKLLKQDPLLELQDSARASLLDPFFSTPILNFAGQAFAGASPPDTVGDVGRDYYIQMVNASGGARFNVYNKNNGSLAAGPTLLETLGAGGACASGFGDGIVLYDQLADRWLMSEFAGSGFHLCVYISQTSNPIVGGWFRYDFSTPNFPDYPKYAVWPDAYYVSSNENSPAAYALDRTRMLQGLSATSQRFTAPDLPHFGFQALTPSDQDGILPAPAGSPNYFMRHRDDEAANPGSNDPIHDFLEIWRFHVDFAVPANSTFTGPTNIAVSEFDSDLCGFFSFNCFPQPGTGTTLDPLREVVMWRLQYRNFGSYETLASNLVTDVDGTNHGGIRWFELRKSGAGPWTLYQEGTYAPDVHHRWMASLGIDGVGNMAMGYSVSSTTVFPSIRYVGRLQNDPLGTMPQGENSLVGGTGSSSTNRWGDYSALSVDPSDNCTFWYTHERANGTWSTQIGAFKFAACRPSLIIGPGVGGPDRVSGYFRQ